MTSPTNPFVGSQSQRWIARQHAPDYWGAAPAGFSDPAAAVPPTVVPNPYVGAQAQRWLARQHAPDYWGMPPLGLFPDPSPPAPPTIIPNLYVGSQAQRWLSRQRNPGHWPVDTPASYILPVTPPGGAGLCIRGGYGFVGIADGAVDGVYWRMAAFVYQTDSQYIAMVLGDEGGASAEPTVLYFHCDTGFTKGAFLSISYTGFTLGAFTRAGNTITYQPFNDASVSMLLLSGQIVGVQNINNAYTVLVNGQPLLEFTGGGVAMGAAYRSAAVSMSRFTDGNNFVWDSYRLAALSLADYVQPVYTGTGARMSRHSTSSTNGTSGAVGTRTLETSLFDTIDIATANITPNLTNGTFTVSMAGWYRITARLQTPDSMDTVTTSSSIAELVLYRNGSVVQYGMDFAVGFLGGGGTGGNVKIHPTSLWASFDASLNVNDTVQIGLNVIGTGIFTTAGGAGDVSATGESIGGKTFVDIALLNARTG